MMQNRIRQAAATLVALFVISSVFGPVGMVAAQPGVSISQTADSTTVAPGGTVTLTATLDVQESNSPAIDVDLPAGWTVTSHTDDGATFKSSETQWVWLEGDADGVNVTHTVTYTVEVPEGESVGDHDILVEGSVIDPGSSSRIADTQTTTISVQDVNQAPTADAGPDQTVDESATVVLDGEASSDPDGDALTYSWTQMSGPSVTLDDDSAATPSFAAPEVDAETTLSFELTVSDGETSDTDTVDVTVQDVDEPAADMETSVSLSPASDETFVGGTTTYDLVVDDTTGGVGAYSATVTIEDPSVGAITDVDLQGSPAGQTTNVDIASDGSSVSIDAALMDTADSGSVSVATITVQGTDAGSTDLTPSVSALGNESGVSYTVTGTSDATLSVTEKSTSVSLSPSSQEISVDDTTTYDLVVDNAEGGVGAYSANVSIDDPSVGAITDVQLLGSPAEQTSSVDISSDGSSVSIDAALMDTADSGSVTVATITVEGENAGAASLSTSVDALGDEDGNNYAVTGTNGADLTVTEVIVGDFVNPVNDPDADGEYEDINGDGQFDIVDIQALFANLNDDAVQNNPTKFDFNDDGVVDIVDVQALFFELTN